MGDPVVGWRPVGRLPGPHHDGKRAVPGGRVPGREHLIPRRLASMQLRGVIEKTIPSSDGDKRTRESQTPRLSAPARRRSLPWLMLGVLLVAGCALAFA